MINEIEITLSKKYSITMDEIEIQCGTEGEKAVDSEDILKLQDLAIDLAIEKFQDEADFTYLGNLFDIKYRTKFNINKK